VPYNRGSVQRLATRMAILCLTSHVLYANVFMLLKSNVSDMADACLEVRELGAIGFWQ